jgi:hypothetical protein
MGELSQVIMFLGICIGILAGGSITVWAAGMAGFLSEIYKEWHDGLQLAHLVKEKERERRAELLAKMIELQRTMQPEPSEESVIAKEQVVNEVLACQRNGVPDGERDAGGNEELPRP